MDYQFPIADNSRKRYGAEGGSRTRTSLRTTDFKSAFSVLTKCYYTLPSSIYQRFSRQSKRTSGLVEAHNPLIFPSSFKPSCNKKSFGVPVLENLKEVVSFGAWIVAKPLMMLCSFSMIRAAAEFFGASSFANRPWS